MIKSPFKFLDSYSLEDRNTFFGRDQEITDLFRKVLEGKILLVYGISGTGKSSLVNCGLASKFDQSDWLPINVRRGGNIINSLNEAVNRHAITSLKKTQSFVDKIQSLYLDHFKPVFLIFDQFEELFIFGSPEEKKEFLELIKAVLRSRINCNVIFVIREEFLAGMTEFDYDLPEIFSNRYRVEKMKKANAISAIEGPCKVNGIEVEHGFSEALINKLTPSGTDVELTYLQIYLDRIFKIASEGRTETDGLEFSNELLNKAGSVSDLLGQFLDEQVRQLDDPDTGMSILKSFVSVQGTKRQMNEQEILDSVKAFGTVITEPDLLKYLTKFVDLRILRERDEAGHFELRHDSLASKIYEKFTALEKDIIEVRQFLENAYNNQLKRGVLLSADDLEYIAPYKSRLYLPDELNDLLDKSKKELVKVKQKRRIIAFSGITILLIVFAGFTFWALKERDKAIGQSLRAKVLLLVAKAKESTISDPTKAIRYAQLAYYKDSTNVYANQTLSDIFYATDVKPFYAFSMGHSSYVNSAVFSPDGKYILTSSADKTAKLWDLSGKCLVTLSGHSEKVNSAAFSPDGKSILTVSLDKTAKLWDLSGKWLVTFSGHSDYVNSALFSPDGRYILTASWDKTAKLWDLSGKCLVTLSGHSSSVWSAVFSADGKSILTASVDKTAKLWDLSGKCLVTLSGHSSSVGSALFSPDGKSILTASGDKTAKLWDLSGKCLVTLSGHSSSVGSALFSPEGKSILTASGDGTAKLWDLSGKCLVTLSGHSSYVRRALFSPDGRYILTASGDKTAKLWDLSGKCRVTFSGHSETVYSAVFSPDGKSILTASGDNTTKLWDLSEKRLVTLSGHSSYVNSAVFSPDCRLILTAYDDKTAKLWDLSGKCLATFSGHSLPVHSAVFSADGNYILTASLDNTAKLWDLSGKCLVTLPANSSYGVIIMGFEVKSNFANFSPDSRCILTASWDGSAKLWDLSGKCLVTLSGHSADVTSALFSPDGRYILTAAGDKTAKLWDISGKCLVTLSGHLFEVSSAVFSPDGRSILTASLDNTAKLWDLSGKCLVTLSGHSKGVNSAVFSPDGKSILTASDDKTAKLWDISGKCLVTLSGHSYGVSSAVFSPDGRSILTASLDKTAKLWDLSGKCLVTLSGHSYGVNSAVFSPDGKYILLTSSENKAELWPTPAHISNWLITTQIGSLSPSDKSEIDELDDFNVIQQSDNLANITDYADWYLGTKDTTKAISLYIRAMELNPMSINKRILGDIYRKQKKQEEYSALYKDNPESAIKDDMAALRDTSSINNYSGKFNFFTEKAWLFEKLLKVESTAGNNYDAAENYNYVGWYGLLSGNYNEALKAIQRGIELDPSNEMLYTNLPLCYLLTGQYEKAKSIYLEFKNKAWTTDNRAKTFIEVFLSDITSLEKAGITHPDFEKVKALLKK